MTHQRIGAVRRVVAVVAGSVLVAGDVVALVALVLAWLIRPSGSYDELVAAAQVAVFAAVVAFAFAVLSLGAVLARWPGRWWWVAVPAVIAALAIIRLNAVPFV